MPRGQGATFKTETWQQQIVSPSQKVLRIQVYYTESDIQEHAPIRKLATANSDLIDDIEEWGPPLEFELLNFKAAGFKTKQPDTWECKGYYYEFYWRLTLEGKGANMTAQWEIAAPDTQPFDEDDGRPKPSQLELLEGKEAIIVEEKFNPITKIGL